MLLCCILPRGFCISMILFLKLQMPPKIKNNKKKTKLSCQVVDQRAKNIPDTVSRPGDELNHQVSHFTADRFPFSPPPCL